jgi:hypothetical protein
MVKQHSFARNSREERSQNRVVREMTRGCDGDCIWVFAGAGL